MLKTIFAVMDDMGWRLGDNTVKCFTDILEMHRNQLDDMYNDNTNEKDDNGGDIVPIIKLSQHEIIELSGFVGDFIRAVMKADNYTKKEGAK